jgi:hypothetical protein
MDINAAIEQMSCEAMSEGMSRESFGSESTKQHTLSDSMANRAGMHAIARGLSFE